MPVSLRTGPYTFGDFLELVQEDQKADLINGVIFMASPESLEHNDAIGFLFRLLAGYVEHRGIGRVFVNRIAFRIGDKSGPEPDIGFVERARFDRFRRGYVDGPPDFAIEIVSPSSVEHDYERKRLLYETAGVGEYWIIDPDEKSAVFLALRDGRFEEKFPSDGRIASCVVPGFEIAMDWIWQQPLPPVAPILQAMIAKFT